MSFTPNKTKSFDVEDPISSPLIMVPAGSEINWGVEPMPPPRAEYKRDTDDIGDNETGISSDWNFVLPDNF